MACHAAPIAAIAVCAGVTHGRSAGYTAQLDAQRALTDAERTRAERAEAQLDVSCQISQPSAKHGSPAEAVIPAGMLAAGCGLLGQLLAADPGYRGPGPVRAGS